MEVLGVIGYAAWAAVGLWGLVIAKQKGYMNWFGQLGLVSFLLFGWIVAVIVLVLPMALGPIMWMIAKYGMPDRRNANRWAPSARPE